jgi:hypothetical protein
MIRMHVTRSHLLFAAVAVVLTVLLCSLHGLGFAVAHADPVGAVTVPPPAVDWLSIIATTGVVLVGLGAILGYVSAALHWLAPRTKTTLDDRAAAGVDVIRSDIAELAGAVRAIAGAAPAPSPVSVSVTNHTVPSDLPVTVTKSVPAVALLAMLLVGAIALQPACSGTTQVRATAGATAALNCEQSDLAAAALDGLALASTAILSTISGSGHPDATALKAALGAIKSDGLRCAVAGAIATMLTPAPAPAGAPAAAGLDVDAGELRAAFASVRAGWGVSSVRVAGQVL